MSSDPTSAEARLASAILIAVAEYERDRQADSATRRGGDSGYGDPLSREYLRWLAHRYDRHRDNPGEMRALLDGITEDLTLDDVRVLRTAAEAAVAATPRIVRKAKDGGMKPPRIAEEIRLTVSRIYQLLREQPADDDQ